MTQGYSSGHDVGSGARNEALQVEMAKLLYANLPASIVVNTLLALILVSVLSPVVGAGRLLGWLLLLGVVLSARMVLLLAWQRKGQEAGSRALHWIRRFRILIIATGAVWGIAAVLLAPSGDIPHQVYISFVLAGLSAGAITSLAIDRVSTLGFLLPTLLPQIAFFVMEGGAIVLGMSAMIVLFLLFIMTSASRARRSLLENFQLRIHAVENESRLRFILENSPIATRITSAATGQVVFANQRYAKLRDSVLEKVIGSSPAPYYADPQEYAEIMAELDQGGQVTNRLVELLIPDGRGAKWVLASYLRLEYQGEDAILGWFYDITDRKKMEEQAQHLAHHDPLTGLPNRMLFTDRLQQALFIARRDSTLLALMFLDLDKFKQINDTLGHNVGDLLLKEAARRLQDCLRESDTVARIGGDEFIVLLPAVKSEWDALQVAEKIRSALNRSFMIAGHDLQISSSIGVAIYPQHGVEEKQLIRNADTAMYYAKNGGRDNVKLYHPDMRE